MAWLYSNLSFGIIPFGHSWYGIRRCGVHLLTSCCRLSGLKVLLIPPIYAHLITEDIRSDISLDNPRRLLLGRIATQVDSDVQLYLVFWLINSRAGGRRKKLLDFNYRLLLFTREGSSYISPCPIDCSWNHSQLHRFVFSLGTTFLTALLLPAVSTMDQMAYKLRRMNSHWEILSFILCFKWIRAVNERDSLDKTTDPRHHRLKKK